MSTPMTALKDYSFSHRIKVRWVEVDPQQVVFNGHYLMYFDTAMSEYWRATGHPYPEGFRFFGGEVFIRKNTVEYHAPGRLDDVLDIGIRCERIGNSSITMAWAVWTQGRLLVTGESVYVLTTLKASKPMAVPQGLRQQIERLATGQDVLEVTTGPWSALSEPASAVRRAVFIQEQGIDESDEWDEDDASAVHALVQSRAGLALGTGRLIVRDQPPGHAKIGRMAVIKSARDRRIGERLLSALVEQAAPLQIKHITLSAQCSALRFYERAGFVAQGEVYDEVGIPHQRMIKSI